MAEGLYTLVNQEHLHDILETLHAFIQLPIQLIGENGRLLEIFGRTTSYCELLKKHIFSNDECLRLHLKAGERAQALGGTYIFACHANLNHIAFPLQSQGRLLACIIIGPFLMETPDSTLVSALAEHYTLTSALSLELYDELRELQIMAPARVNQLSRLVYHLLSPLLPTEMSLLLKNQEGLYQQSRINESIQMYKEQQIPATPNLLYQKENDLMAKVRTGNTQEAKELLNEFLGYVLFSEGNRLDSIRTHAVELTTLLSRVAIEGGARADNIYRLTSQYLLELNGTATVDSMCGLLQNVVESFMDAMFSRQDKGNNHIREALRIMSERYADPLTLAEVADGLGLSANYLSALFKQTVGVGFREQLNRIRVEESKRLLLSTDFPLAEIAIAMGFTDQSYFCKTFKRLTGITPSQFRN